jgi:predicted transcriptional regulator of viral defense system
MKILQLRQINKKYFNLRQLANALKISVPSARVLASRYVKNGILIRIKRDLYILSEQWDFLSLEEKFQLANLIQTPSYVSLLTALSYYEISTQIQQEFIESVAIKRTKQVEVNNSIFNFSKLKNELYFGFVRKQGFFIAEPEKALLDAFYLMGLKKYTLDVDTIDFEKIDTDKMKMFSSKFPAFVKKLINYYELT